MFSSLTHELLGLKSIILQHFTHKASMTIVHAKANSALYTQSTRSVHAAVLSNHEKDFTMALKCHFFSSLDNFLF